MFSSLARLLFLSFMLCGPLFSPAHAAIQQESNLTSKINSLLTANNKHAKNQPHLRITILTPSSKLEKLCPQPELRLAGHAARLTGHRTIIARCDKKQTFIQIKISACGTYWIATQTLKPGQVVATSDIQAVSGELDKLPAGLLLDAENIIGSTPTRVIQTGQPLVEHQLRRRWVVLANRNVEIIAVGEGFLIHSRGQALNNAALNEKLRIKTRNGQVLTATASGEGKVTVNMNN